jgi:hypothetical protein
MPEKMASRAEDVLFHPVFGEETEPQLHIKKLYMLNPLGKRANSAPSPLPKGVSIGEDWNGMQSPGSSFRVCCRLRGPGKDALASPQSSSSSPTSYNFFILISQFLSSSAQRPFVLTIQLAGYNIDINISHLWGRWWRRFNVSEASLRGPYDSRSTLRGSSPAPPNPDCRGRYIYPGVGFWLDREEPERPWETSSAQEGR